MKQNHSKRRQHNPTSVEQLEGRTLLAVDFSIAAMSDTQYVVETQALYPTFGRQTAWVAAHKNDANYNFAFLAHQGDMLRRGYSNQQATVAANALQKLDDAKVPYAVSIGNHDYDNQFDDLNRHVSSANFTSYFGDARYQAHKTANTIKEYGSSLDQRNHYHVFTAGGRDFLLLSLEWQAPTAARAWGQRVLDTHQNLPVILQTHEYLSGSVGSRTTSTPYDAAQLGAVNGQQLFTNFVVPNPQIFMVLSGHTGATWNRKVTTDASGRTIPAVFEIAADFEGSQPNGGDGWLQTIGFDLAAGSIKITNVRPGDPGDPTATPAVPAVPDQVGTSTTYSGINFASRFTFATRTVSPAPTPGATPVAVADALATPEGKPVTFNPVVNDTDADTAKASLKPILTSLPKYGALYVNNDGTFTYTPDPKTPAAFTGTDSFAYAVTDGQTKSAPVDVTVTVRPSVAVYTYPSDENPEVGTITGGSFENLKASDNVVETIDERIATGDDLRHVYTFTNVPAGADPSDSRNLVLGFNAWRTFSNPGTGDEYTPQWSIDGVTWTDPVQFVVKGGTDVVRTQFDADEPYQLLSLPSHLSGTIYIRFRDVSPGGAETVDTLTVDEIFIRSAIPTVTIAKTSDGAESTANDRPVTFTVTRNGSGPALQQDLTVNYTLSGTATAGADYTAPYGTVTIPAGATSATFSIVPLTDEVLDDAETIIATLSSAAGHDASTTAGSASAKVADINIDTTPPSKPTGVIVATTAADVTMTWAASTDDRGGPVTYDLTRNGVAIATGLTTTTFTDTNRAANTTYAYAITARDAANNASAATTFSATTQLAAPSNLAGSKVKNKAQAKLTWRDNNSGESGFYVYASLNGATPTRHTVAALTGTGGTATWTSPTLARGTWTFYVTTYNTNGESDPTATPVSVLI